MALDRKAQVILPPSGLHLWPTLAALFGDSANVFDSAWLFTVPCLLTEML